MLSLQWTHLLTFQCKPASLWGLCTTDTKAEEENTPRPPSREGCSYRQPMGTTTQPRGTHPAVLQQRHHPPGL